MKGRVVWMESVDSTNEEMKRRLKVQHSLTNLDSIVSNFQTEGKGQREAKWESNSGENLTFSFYFQPNNLKVKDAFKLNQAVSILIADYLKSKKVKNIQIKWPNDILINQKKVCGVLIENSLSKDDVLESIIGIGLNVNQMEIISNSNSTSLSNELHEQFLIKVIAEELISYIEKVEDFINRPVLLQNRYLDLLLGLGEERNFLIQTEQVKGKILGIDSAGKLRVSIDEVERLFEQKEIRFLFD